MRRCYTRGRLWRGHDGAVKEAIAKDRKAPRIAVSNDRVIQPRLKQTIVALETRFS
jgi:hypothetical protein